MEALPTIAVTSDSPRVRLDDENIYIFMRALELEQFLNAQQLKFPKETQHDDGETYIL